MSKPLYYIKENSWLARMAAKKMKATAIAMVLGATIHLYGTTKANFLDDSKWLKHEICHINQFKKHGYFIFIIKYILEWVLVGYYHNKYEIEARQAENG